MMFLVEPDCSDVIQLVNEVNLDHIGSTLIIKIHDLIMGDWVVLVKHVRCTVNSVADSPTVALLGQDPEEICHERNAQVNRLDNSGTCFNACCVNLASSAASHGPINVDNWIIDSGATHHVTPDAAKVSHGSDYNGPATTVHQAHNTTDGGTRESHGHASGSNGGSHTSQGHDNQAMSSDGAVSAREVLDTSTGISVDDHNSVSADLGQTESQDVQSSSIHSEGTHGFSESRQACENDTEVAINSEQAVVSAQTDRHEFLVNTNTEIVFINKQQHFLKFFHSSNNM
ncbi:hypothetical protein GQ457_01G012570 [Hibiscus cannabinus]